MPTHIYTHVYLYIYIHKYIAALKNEGITLGSQICKHDLAFSWFCGELPLCGPLGRQWWTLLKLHLWKVGAKGFWVTSTREMSKPRQTKTQVSLWSFEIGRYFQVEKCSFWMHGTYISIIWLPYVFFWWWWFRSILNVTFLFHSKWV